MPLSTSSAFLICFIAPAFLVPISNGMVSSTMWTEEAFQLTTSDLSWVTAMDWYKVAIGHDATYWLKWTAGNDVRVRASGVGRRGWNVVWVGVCCGLLWSISYFPLFPSCTQIWCWVNNGFHHHDTPRTCSVVSVPTWMVFQSRSLSRLPTASPSTLPF